MNSAILLNQYLEERNDLLERIADFLNADPFVKAAWLAGSFGRGEEDALSDFDLWVIVEDGYIDSVRNQPRQYTSQVGHPLLFLEAPQNAPVGGAYLMTCYDAPVAPHIVDWYWQPQSMANIPEQAHLLFDRAGLVHQDQPDLFTAQALKNETVERPIHFVSFFWMMLMITAKHTYRSPWSVEMALLPHVLNSLHKAQLFLGQDIRSPAGNVPSQRLPAEKMQLLFQLADQMNDLMASLSERGEEMPGRIAPGAYRYLKFIELLMQDKQQKKSGESC